MSTSQVPARTVNSTVPVISVCPVVDCAPLSIRTNTPGTGFEFSSSTKTVSTYGPNEVIELAGSSHGAKSSACVYTSLAYFLPNELPSASYNNNNHSPVSTPTLTVYAPASISTISVSVN